MNVQRIVQRSDQERIENFLNEDVYLHRHLDWDSFEDWISNPGFLIDETDGEVTGLLACIKETHGGTWIRLFSCPRSMNPLEVWNRIFLHLTSQYGNLLDRQLNSLAFSDWFQRLLFTSGFLTNYSVVVLRNNHLSKIFSGTDLTITIRTFEEIDLPMVTEIDHQSFLDLWQISENTLKKAQAYPSYGSVAEFDGHLVGYQISTIDHQNAHLSRLAVLPNYQNLKIGRSIIRELFTHLTNIGVTSLSVNTQSNNISSLALYKSCGFVCTGESFPVFELINSNCS